MTRMLWGSCVVIVVFMHGAVCGAQCASGFNTMTVQCAGPNGCMDQKDVDTPIESQDGVRVVCGSVSCCGQLLTTCSGSGNCEPVRALREPRAQERLARVAAESEVLVADCKGRYALFKPSPGTVLNQRSLALLDDRILR